MQEFHKIEKISPDEREKPSELIFLRMKYKSSRTIFTDDDLLVARNTMWQSPTI